MIDPRRWSHSFFEKIYRHFPTSPIYFWSRFQTYEQAYPADHGREFADGWISLAGRTFPGIAVLHDDRFTVNISSLALPPTTTLICASPRGKYSRGKL